MHQIRSIVALKIYLLIRREANPGIVASIGLNYLAQWCDCSKQAVIKGRAELKSLGLIDWEEGGGRKHRTLYRINSQPPLTVSGKQTVNSGNRKQSTTVFGNSQLPLPKQSTPVDYNQELRNQELLESKTPTTTTPASNDAVAAVGSFSKKKKSAEKKAPKAKYTQTQEDAISAMRSLGIKGKTPFLLIEQVPTLTAAAVDRIASNMESGAGIGLLVESIKFDGADAVEEAKQQERITKAIARGKAEEEKERRLLQAKFDRWVSEYEDRYKADTAAFERALFLMQRWCEQQCPPKPSGVDLPADTAMRNHGWDTSLKRSEIAAKALAVESVRMKRPAILESITFKAPVIPWPTQSPEPSRRDEALALATNHLRHSHPAAKNGTIKEGLTLE